MNYHKNNTLLNFEYCLFENDNRIYSSQNLNLVIHELLSILLNYLSFQKNNNVTVNITKTNMHINVYLTDQNKRYPVLFSTITFDPINYTFETNPKNLEIQLEDYNTQLVQKFRSIQIKPNIVMNKLKSLDADEIKSIKNKTTSIKEKTSTLVKSFIDETNKLVNNNSNKTFTVESGNLVDELKCDESMEEKIRDQIENLEKRKKKKKLLNKKIFRIKKN